VQNTLFRHYTISASLKMAAGKEVWGGGVGVELLASGVLHSAREERLMQEIPLPPALRAIVRLRVGCAVCADGWSCNTAAGGGGERRGIDSRNRVWH
jgi:hypothetical protein